MVFCSKCGKEISDSAKFCCFCGAPSTQITTQREHIYEGTVYKCPNCGEVLDSFESNCSSCGHEVRKRRTSDAVQNFVMKVEMAESHEKRLSIIRNFPIPNTKEDLCEFLFLSASNISVDAKNFVDGEEKKQKELLDAWRVKFEQAYLKAEVMLSDDPVFPRIKNLYDSNKVLKNKKRKRKLGTTWKVLAIVFVSVAGVLFIIFSSIFFGTSLTNKTEREEVERLEKIVEQIESALEEGEYSRALMNADRLVFGKGNEDLARDWEIQREYWIDKVIEEAEKKGVTLERPVDPSPKIKIGYSHSDLEGKDYREVEKKLEYRGFTNIVLQEVFRDSEEGIVEEIQIDGESWFYESDSYVCDARIVIYYNAVMQQEE